MAHTALEPTSQQRGEGFTLVELLVVLAVIALLAALLLPSLSRARNAADAAACKSNLRQLAIGLSLYTDDFGVFPRTWTFSNGTLRYWLHDLENYVGARWPDTDFKSQQSVERKSGVFVCPAYSRLGGMLARGDFGVNFPAGAYGYNAAGASHHGNNFGFLGLGGHALTWPAASPDHIRPLRQNEVRNPGDMIAFGDAALEDSTDYGLIGHPDLSYGLIWYPVRLEVNGMPLRTGGVEPWSSRSRLAMRRRHNGRWNIVFCDGHVEQMKIRDLYGLAPNSLRRWNNDNLPHRELLP